MIDRQKPLSILPGLPENQPTLVVPHKDAGEIASLLEKAGDIASVTANLRERIAHIMRATEATSTPNTEAIQARANYQGDWTVLTLERLSDPLTYAKFLSSKLAAFETLKSGNPGPLDKKEDFQPYAEQQMRDYYAVLSTVFASTRVSKARESSKSKHELGLGNYGTTPIVFIDAQQNGADLTPRQKNIIESHEAGHGVRKMIGLESTVIRGAIELDKIPTKQKTYFQRADEITERMAQLKNYFGFKAQDIFTQEHLDYAREHYIQDTGLDNSMSVFFGAITKEREAAFIEIMNMLPI